LLIDHIDLRVRNFDAARAFYDPLLITMGYTEFDVLDRDINYHAPGGSHSEPFFGLMEDTNHRANGARNFEPPEPYHGSPRYYAAFFEDPDGNKLEVVYRA
jgi:catechol 2,3-dioxygenase-like lactoylglutathione lyase family enzyme